VTTYEFTSWVDVSISISIPQPSKQPKFETGAQVIAKWEGVEHRATVVTEEDYRRDHPNDVTKLGVRWSNGGQIASVPEHHVDHVSDVRTWLARQPRQDSNVSTRQNVPPGSLPRRGSRARPPPSDRYEFQRTSNSRAQAEARWRFCRSWKSKQRFPSNNIATTKSQSQWKFRFWFCLRVSGKELFQSLSSSSERESPATESYLRTATGRLEHGDQHA